MERIPSLLRGSAGALIVLALAGCNRDSVREYRLAKAAPSPASNDVAAPPNPAATASPQLTWSLPAGWEQKPASGMRVASFTVTGKDGQTADVSVIPMSAGEPELDLVNMWRQQLQLPAVAAEGAGSQPEAIAIGSNQGKLFDIASEAPILDGKSRARILVAMADHGGTSWFFKMTGADALVSEQKPVFIQFLKSISIHSDGASAEFANAHRFLSTNARETPSENSEKPVWVAPPDWRELPPSQFLLAKFEAAGTGGAKAEISVSMLGGTGGGLLANVNRWRQQIGLEPVEADALSKLITSAETEGGKVEFVDLAGTDPKTSQPVRLVAAVVPQTGQTWFYKLMGDPQVVGEQKDAFAKFVKTVKYSNVP